MIVRDLLKTQSLKRDNSGYHTERVFIIEDVTGSPESKLYNALQDSGIPRIGEPHPVIPDIFVSDINAEPLTSGEQVKVTVVYDPLDEEDSQSDGSGSISVSSGTVNEQVFKDINGDLLKVSFNSTTGFTESIRTVDVQRPQLNVTLSRIEDQLPRDAMQNVIGKVNSAPWSGFPQKTWLCIGMNVNKDNDKYDVEYRFAYNEKTWQAEITININNAVPVGATLGDGIEVYDVYESANFNDLGVSF